MIMQGVASYVQLHVQPVKTNSSVNHALKDMFFQTMNADSPANFHVSNVQDKNALSAMEGIISHKITHVFQIFLAVMVYVNIVPGIISYHKENAYRAKYQTVRDAQVQPDAFSVGKDTIYRMNKNAHHAHSHVAHAYQIYPV